MSRGWNDLPPEMNLSILELLSLQDLKAFSVVGRSCRQLTMSTLFKSVKLDGYEVVESFLSRFPSTCRTHIRSLFVSMRPQEVTQQRCDCAASQTDLLVSLLSTCTMIQSLTLYVYGSPQKHIVPPFARLNHLTSLFIGTVAPEQLMPLSERSVVSIAASIPRLQRLTLDGITRSLVHAPELLADYPFVPLVVGDEDVEPHPVLGSHLSLPSLLRIPTLRKLQLSETHLGDPLWGTTKPSTSHLEVLDLGACGYVTPEVNRVCAERIINNLAGSSPIRELFVSTPLQDDKFRDPFSTPLQSLDHVHLMPLLPVDSVVETLFALSGSPVHTISVECYEEDAVDMCYALEDFLSVRLREPEAFYRQLRVINLDFVPLDPSFPRSDHNWSLGRVRRLCDVMGIGGEMPSLTTEPSGTGRVVENRVVRKPWWNASQDANVQDATW